MSSYLRLPKKKLEPGVRTLYPAVVYTFGIPDDTPNDVTLFGFTTWATSDESQGYVRGGPTLPVAWSVDSLVQFLTPFSVMPTDVIAFQPDVPFGQTGDYLRRPRCILIMDPGIDYATHISPIEDKLNAASIAVYIVPINIVSNAFGGANIIMAGIPVESAAAVFTQTLTPPHTETSSIANNVVASKNFIGGEVLVLCSAEVGLDYADAVTTGGTLDSSSINTDEIDSDLAAAQSVFPLFDKYKLVMLINDDQDTTQADLSTADIFAAISDSHYELVTTSHSSPLVSGDVIPVIEEFFSLE